ncbi:MAG: enoyl-CoA hydratase/isomerase family protein [Phenylobacterium sp.]|nr:enoyl-CoA hydratase/isomerase family protein [Phenylobacterium sp.]
MSGEVRIEIEARAGGACVAHVILDNAAKLNTLNSALMKEFAARIGALAKDEHLRAVVLTGAGDRAFIGGADIDEMAGLDAATARAFITRVHRCCEVLRDVPVPVIGRINGYALGAGMEVAAACDLRVAADSAMFGMPEVKLGIPSVVEAALLPSLVGWGRTRQMLLLGESFSAAQAQAWGLVEAVVPAAGLDAQVEAWLESLLAAEPGAVRLQKALIRRWEDLPMKEAIDAGIDAFEAAWATDAPTKAMAEFQAGRAARRTNR